jgi:hypothetical protein
VQQLHACLADVNGKFVSGIQLVLVHVKIKHVLMLQAVTLMMLLVQDI